MDSDTQNHPEEAQSKPDQGECSTEKAPLPSNRTGIENQDDVVSGDLSSGAGNQGRPAGEGRSYVDGLMRDGKPTCNICNKSFGGLKSLFGHMRCHPERRWRGMQPPPHRPNSSPSPNCSEGADVADGGSRLDLPSGWSVKDRRGRKRPISYDDNDDDDKEKLYNAAHGLVLLSLAESVKCYKCVTCDKSFASHRALGGHRASAHNNKALVKNSGRGSVVEDGIFESKSGGKVVDGECDDHLNSEEMSAKMNHHVCRTCEKVFASGQALGGHQRLHWQGPVGGRESAPPAPSSASSSNSPAGQQLMSKKMVFEFDLNEIPVDDDQGEV